MRNCERAGELLFFQRHGKERHRRKRTVCTAPLKNKIKREGSVFCKQVTPTELKSSNIGRTSGLGNLRMPFWFMDSNARTSQKFYRVHPSEP